MSIRRERDSRRVAKSVRSHQETMAAYDRQIDTPLDYMSSNHWHPVGPEIIVPGRGHVTTHDKDIDPSGRYRINLTRRGTAGIGDARNTTASYEKKFFDKRAAKKAAKEESGAKNDS